MKKQRGVAARVAS